LTDWQIETHAPKFHELTEANAQLYSHVNNGPYTSSQQFLEEFIQPLSFDNEYMVTYAIIDKSLPPSPEDPDGQLVGMISYVDADDESYSVEIGFIIVTPEFQNRGIGTTAAALMVKHALDREEDGGLGLCRVEWHCSTMNTASIKTAHKLRFREIGVVEYERILPEAEARGKIGNGKSPRFPLARNYGDWLNKNHKSLGMKKLNIDNPYNAPPGAIVVVRPGTPGTRHKTAGDIVVVGKNGHFYNGGEMGYRGPKNFPPGNKHVIGIFVPA